MAHMGLAKGWTEGKKAGDCCEDDENVIEERMHRGKKTGCTDVSKILKNIYEKQ